MRQNEQRATETGSGAETQPNALQMTGNSTLAERQCPKCEDSIEEWHNYCPWCGWRIAYGPPGERKP
jgi:hypothetical protein